MYTSTDALKADYQTLLEGFVAALCSYNSAIAMLIEKTKFESFRTTDCDYNVLLQLHDNINSFIPRADVLRAKIIASVNCVDNPLYAGYFTGLLLKWNDVCNCVNKSFDFLSRNGNNALKEWIGNGKEGAQTVIERDCNNCSKVLAMWFRNLQFCIVEVSIIHPLVELDVVNSQLD
ncbi:MAG: hypothetical protein MJZ24_07125 [Paludibacteraceae bacterium]|nr:hypothetical protein [Paludibacteraceae bacterium]